MSVLNSNNQDFQKLIQSAQNGNTKALETLIRQVQKTIYATFYHLTDKKEDIADLTQETLLKMAKYINTLKDVSKFKSWINKIVSSVFYNYMKKNSHIQMEFNEEYLNEIKDKFSCSPGQKCFLNEINKLIRATVIALPHNLKITLILREFEGLSYEDISKITNVSLGTVKSRIARARARLQKELKNYI